MAQPQTIARPYAKAIFALTKSDADQQQWQQFLNAAASLATAPEVVQHLRTPGFAQNIEQWLAEWLQSERQSGLTDQEHNFLRLLEEHARIPVLPEIAAAFAVLCSQSNNTTIVHVKSAQPLKDQECEALSALLQGKLGCAVELEIESAPELLAGILIEYDGQVIDQSMQGRLQQFARKLDD